MKDMLDILRAVPARQLLADIVGLICLVVTLYGVTVIASGMVP